METGTKDGATKRVKVAEHLAMDVLTKSVMSKLTLRSKELKTIGW